MNLRRTAALLGAVAISTAVTGVYSAQWWRNSDKGRDAGILYEVWHVGAAHLMHRNEAAGAPLLTVERVIRSDGNLTLNDVFGGGGPPVPPGFQPDIYNTEPALGAYICTHARMYVPVCAPLCC